MGLTKIFGVSTLMFTKTWATNLMMTIFVILMILAFDSIWIGAFKRPDYKTLWKICYYVILAIIIWLCSNLFSKITNVFINLSGYSSKSRLIGLFEFCENVSMKKELFQLYF